MAMQDAEYYAARLSAELVAMGKATDDNARAAHQALAEGYRQLLAESRSPTQSETVWPIAG